MTILICSVHFSYKSCAKIILPSVKHLNRCCIGTTYFIYLEQIAFVLFFTDSQVLYKSVNISIK